MFTHHFVVLREWDYNHFYSVPIVPPIPLTIFTDSNETPATPTPPPTTAASICDELMLKQMEIKDEKKKLKASVTYHC
jgi:hypothetical protein